MRNLVKTCIFICPSLVIDLKKVYNISSYTAIKAREFYEQIQSVQIVGKVKYVGRR
jgi:hypothetical protein